MPDESVALKDYIEAILDEQRRGMLVAEQEREKSAQALAVTLAEQIRVGDQALRDHVDQQVQQIRAALDAADVLERQRVDGVRDRVEAVRRELQLALDGMRLAVAKQEDAYNERFRNVNEWRGQSADRERSQESQMRELSTTFLPREVGDAQLADIRNSVETQIAELRRQLAELSEKVGKLV